MGVPGHEAGRHNVGRGPGVMGYLIREESVEDVDVRVVARGVPCLGHGQFRGQDADVFALLCDHLAVSATQMKGHQND